jgi:hypothetical protein
MELSHISFVGNADRELERLAATGLFRKAKGEIHSNFVLFAFR